MSELPTGWTETNLGEVVELKRGYDLPKRLREKGEVPIISSSGFSGTHSESKVAGPGVVTGRYGTIGEVHWVDEDYWPLNTALYVRDFKGNDEKFIYYFLHSIDYYSYSDKAAVPGVNRNHLHKAEVCIPPIPEQRAIASILGALDDKIELNRRMNATLESLARAIFKSWFVDFDPVKINAGQMPASSQALATHDPKVLDLFPSTFQDSELGPIPEGWQYHSLPDVTTFREGPGILAKDFHDEGVPLIRLAGLKNDVSLLAGCNFLDPAKVEKKWSHFRLEKGDVLLSTSASLGRVAEVNDEAVGTIPYTGLIGFRPIESVTSQRYIRHYLTSSNFQEQVEAMGVGSVLKHFGPTHLKQMKMLVPPLEIQEEFKNAVGKMDEMISKNLRQSAQMAANRDTLLPQLLSGELPVPAALTRAEEALA